jgi:hypothetical protein
MYGWKAPLTQPLLVSEAHMYGCKGRLLLPALLRSVGWARGTGMVSISFK